MLVRALAATSAVMAVVVVVVVGLEPTKRLY